MALIDRLCKCGKDSVLSLVDCKKNIYKHYCIGCYQLENRNLRYNTAYHLGNLFITNEEENSFKLSHEDTCEIKRRVLQDKINRKEMEIKKLESELEEVTKELDILDNKLKIGKIG